MTVPRRFGILRFVGNLLKVIAWIVLILSILSAVGLIVAWPQLKPILVTSIENSGQGAGVLGAQFLDQISPIGIAIPLLLLSVVYFLSLYMTGETMLMQLAVEENTRLTAALLLRMHQETQPEPQGRGGYGSGGGGYGGGFDDL